MLPAERKRLILRKIGEDGRVVAAELSQHFEVSEDTIRRDLRELAADGLLHRVHGGALPLPKPPVVVSHAVRVEQAPAAKAAIAEAVARLVRDGQVITIDGGTTPLHVAEHLPANLRATVISHSLPVLQALAARPGIELIAVGGKVLGDSLVAAGPATVETYRSLRADLCILGVAGVDVDAGVTALTYDEAPIKRAMAEGANVVVAVAAANKLGTAGAFPVVPVNRLTHLVTDAGAAPEVLQQFLDAGVDVVTA